MPSRRLLNRLCAVSLMTFATFMIIAASFDGPAAQAGHHREPSSHASTATSAAVTIIDFAFTPQVITITAGESVEWTNTGSFTHTATSDMGIWDSGDLGPGETFTRTFDTQGSYAYHCLHHPSMQGTIVVQPPAAPPSVTLAGPHTGVQDTVYLFTAAVDPITTSLPITFSWEATHQLPITHVSAALSDTQVFSWTAGLTGAQWITVTASTALGSARGTHVIIIDPLEVHLPLVMNSSGP